MKQAHRPDIFAFSRFDEARDLDFHSYLLVRAAGNVLVDPLPMSDHDTAHLRRQGDAAWIVVTNSDHTRAAARLAAITGARIVGPAAEREGFAIPCARWLSDGDELSPGLRVIAFDGSKTPGELALLVDGHTLVGGDLLRGHVGGRLNLLPDAKLRDRAAAIASVRRLLEFAELDAILVGDGWPIFRDARRAIEELRT